MNLFPRFWDQMQTIGLQMKRRREWRRMSKLLPNCLNLLLLPTEGRKTFCLNHGIAVRKPWCLGTTNDIRDLLESNKRELKQIIIAIEEDKQLMTRPETIDKNDVYRKKPDKVWVFWATGDRLFVLLVSRWEFSLTRSVHSAEQFTWPLRNVHAWTFSKLSSWDMKNAKGDWNSVFLTWPFSTNLRHPSNAKKPLIKMHVAMIHRCNEFLMEIEKDCRGH